MISHLPNIEDKGKVSMSIIYCTHNKLNGKKYIGSHSANNPKYLGSGFRLKKALLKYGRNNFIRTILWEGPEEYKREMEEYYIKLYNAYKNPLFYNMSEKGVGCPSGKYNFIKSDITKQKISKSMIGKNTWTSSCKNQINKSKPVIQYNIDDIYIKEYLSVSEAIRQTNIKTIFLCVSGKTKQAGGFKWKYKNEY